MPSDSHDNQVEDERRARSLTDDDVTLIVDEIEKRVAGMFFKNLGRGIWGMVWNAILIVFLMLIGYGALHK